MPRAYDTVVLELLSGRELYGNPLAAVREMVQNAFDAVHEQIALTRLAWPDPLDVSKEHALRTLQSVELCLEQRQDTLWLVCKDTGVGMTKAIIAKHLLISGSPRTRELRSLERRCENKGFALGCAGQFGIGTLSYFMLGDLLQITTTRSAEAHDSETNGWAFTTEGVGSFGELRRQTYLRRGSKMELRLRSEVVGDPATWFNTLCAYLQNTLSRIPCDLIVTSEIQDCLPLHLKSGWTRSFESIRASAMTGTGADELREREGTDNSAALHALIEPALRCKTREVKLPEGAGDLRLHLLYFDLPGGQSLGFLDTDGDGGKLHVNPIRNGDCLFPTGWASVAWRGFRVDNEEESREYRPPGRSEWTSLHLPNMVLEVNFLARRSAKVKVDRRAIQLTDYGKSALAFAQAQGRALLESFCRDNAASPYALLNLRRSGITGPAPERLYWLGLGDPPKYPARSWDAIQYPATLCSCHVDVLNGSARFQGKRLHVLPCLRDPLDGAESCGLSWAGTATGPDKVVLFDGAGRPRLLPVWTSNPFGPDHAPEVLSTSRFPPEWKNLLGAVFERQSADHLCVAWNRDHPLIKIVRRAPIQAVQASRRNPTRPEVGLLTDRVEAISWLLGLASGNPQTSRGVWNSLIEETPDFLARLWKFLLPDSLKTYPNAPLFVWRESWDPELLAIGPDTWESFRSPEHSDVLKRILVRPDETWCIQKG